MYRVGQTIKIIRMQDDFAGDQYNGKTGTIEYIDSLGQLHGTWGGLAIIPEIDIVIAE